MAEKIPRCPKRSIRKMAKEHKISEGTMRRLVKDNLKKKSLKIQKKQSLSQAQKIKRVNRSLCCFMNCAMEWQVKLCGQMKKYLQFFLIFIAC